jgi:hypothetical protein
VWRQIQDAKQNKETCIIFMSKSPEGCSSTEAIFIYKGEIIQMKSMHSVPPKFQILLINSGCRLYSHVDVSEGDSSNVLCIEDNHIRFYYTSPNDNAWKEKTKIRGSILCLPNWNLQELTDFYLSLGCNEVFMSRMTGCFEDDKTHQHYSLQPNYVTRTVNHTEEHILESVSFTFKGRNNNISGDEFQKIIKIEADTYGYVPRNLFMRVEGFKNYRSHMKSAVDDRTKTLQTIFSDTTTTDIKQRLVQLEPPRDKTGKFDYDGIRQSSWLGNYVI